MKVLVEDYEVFKEILIEEFKQFQLDTGETIDSFQERLDNIKQEMTDFFIAWLEDGTLETIINENIFNGKADKEDLDNLEIKLLQDIVDLKNNMTKTFDELFIHVKDFGAVGDGVTNDYDALKKAWQECSNRDHVTLLFDPVDYYIDEYVTNTNDVEDLFIRNVSSLTIDGRGATIRTKGDFHRTSSNGARGISVFLLENIKNLEIKNIKLDGGLDHTTRDSGLDEPPSYGLRFQNCHMALIHNVETINFLADGIYIGWRELCTYFKLVNVKSCYNARQGLTISHATNVHCDNCDFSYQGTLPYGGHNPRAGVDVEPEWGVSTLTDHLHFTNCHFDYNDGRAFASMYPSSTNRITIIGGSMKNPNYGRDIFATFWNIETKLINVEIDTGEGWILGHDYDTSTLTIQDSLIYSKGRALLATSQVNQHMIIKNNIIIGNHTSSFNPDYFIYLQNSPNVIFKDNTVFIPEVLANNSMINDTGNRTLILLQNIKRVESNAYDTDYSANDRFFTTLYGTTPTVNEDFSKNTHVKPAGLTNYDGSILYTNGMQSLGTGYLVNNRRHEYRTNIPTSGSFIRGDYIFNTQDTIQDGGVGIGLYIIKGWYRITYGSNHVLGVDWAEDRIYISHRINGDE